MFIVSKFGQREAFSSANWGCHPSNNQGRDVMGLWGMNRTAKMVAQYTSARQLIGSRAIGELKQGHIQFALAIPLMIGGWKELKKPTSQGNLNLLVGLYACSWMPNKWGRG